MEMMEIEPDGEARCAVIWLHGLGADGHDFEPLVRQWGLADELGARFILPHAPVRPVTLNNGMRMRAWYDIYDLNFDGEEDGEGIEAASRELLALVEREQRRGVSSERILLAGFSQGGAVALHTAVRHEQALAGVLALSAYLPLHQRLMSERCSHPHKLAVRIDHGEIDPVVPYAVARNTCELLGQAGFDVEFHSYVMEHSLCPQQVDSLRAWLVEHLR